MQAGEKGLVRKATEHDAAAFAQLYEEYVDKIYRYTYYKVGNKFQAEDLTAQVFLKAWEAIHRYHSTDRPFSAWLFRIAHNLIVDYFRMQRPVLPLEEGAEDEDTNLEEVTAHHLDSEMLRSAITKLTDDQQQVIILKFLEGYGTEEVAVLMGKDPGAVRALQHRGLQGLQRILGKGNR